MHIMAHRLNTYTVIFMCSVVTFGLTGCISSVSLKKDRASILEAEERVLTNVSLHNTSRPGRPDPKRIVCAEPSPDTSKVLTQSLSLAGKLADKGELAISQQSAQAVMQLAERTTSIQLLRDQMHRACEAYSNGAITGTTYTMIMSKNNDAMVTLMMGENAAGAFGRSGAAVAGIASGTTIAQFEGATLAFEQAMEEFKAKEAALVEAQKKLDLATSNEEKTKQLKDEADSKPSKDEIKEAEESLDEAQTEFNTAKELRDKALEDVVNKADIALTTSAAFSVAQGQGSLTVTPSTDIASTLSDIQKQYLNRSAVSDFIATCLVEMGQSFMGKEYGGISAEAYFWNRYLAKQVNFRDYLSVLNTERLSWLNEFCYAELEHILRQDQKNHFILEQQEMILRNNQLVARSSEAASQLVNATQKALSECKSLNKNERALCYKTIAKSVDSNADLARLSKRGIGDDPFLPQNRFNQLEDRATKTLSAINDLQNTAIRKRIKDKPSDEKLKTLWEQAEEDHNELIDSKALLTTNHSTYKEAMKYINSSKTHDSAGNTEIGPNDLQSEFLSLQAKLYEQKVAIKDTAQIEALNHLLLANQALSEAMVKQIDKYKKNLAALETEAQNLKSEIDSYHELFKDVLQ